MATMRRFPTADNTDGAWTPSTGADLYACIDEAVQDDADYISSGATNNSTCYMGFTAFAVPAGSTINSVKIVVAAHEVGSAAIEGVLRINGAEWLVGSQSIVNTTPWTAYTFTYSTNPSSGAAWTVNEVNGVGTHGINHIGCKSRSIGVGESADVSWLYCEVDYTPPAAGGIVPKVMHQRMMRG